MGDGAGERVGQWGSGPGHIAPDGSSVDVYLRIGPGQVPRIVDSVLPRGASILELGCATGNVTRELRRLGHAVTAVDESSEMLEHVEPPKIRSAIEDLRLDARFDAVILVSHMLNLVPPLTQQRFLEVSAAHLVAGGRLILELHDPAYFAAAPVEHCAEEFIFRLHSVVKLDSQCTSAIFTWHFADSIWHQHVTVFEFSQDVLEQNLDAVGMHRTGCIGNDPYWVLAEKIG